MNGKFVKNNSNINHSAQPSEWGKKEEMNIAKKYIILILALLPFLGYSQQIFYQDIFYGGVTGSGFSTGGGFGTVNSVIQIPTNSTIKKAFLIAAVDSTPPHNYNFK